MLISNIIISDTHLNFNPPPAGSNSFVFKIERKSMTSAGVYTRDKHLVRTLWSGKVYDAGNYTEQWDGKDDEGKTAPGGNYEIMILSNNMRYDWEGVVGNTSDSFSGETVYHNNYPMYSMAISGDTAYFAVGYNEKKSSQQKFNIHSPQKKILVQANDGGQASLFVATDGVTVYWAGSNTSKEWFVFGTSVSDDSELDFATGKTMKGIYGKAYNAIGSSLQPATPITGLAVQTRGKYLFVSYKSINQVQVLDKKTGNLIQNLKINSPSFIATDKNDNLWISYANSAAEKFAVAANGSLNSQNVSVKDNIDVQALAVSTDSSYILIADGAANSQQLKAYSTASGKQLWTYGRAGGYYASAEVTDDKFYFTDARNKKYGSFIAFAPDGSFWVGDSGNYRSQHYSADRKFIERIMYIPSFYACSADKNNPARVFANYLEFEIDYSKPLAPDNNSWRLVKNWGNAITPDIHNQFFCLTCVTTLSNKRTYALIFQKKTRTWQVLELGANNKLRFTGIELPATSQLYEDGSIRKASVPKIGKPTVWSFQKLKGFDANANPQWEAERVIATSPINTNEEPLFKGNLQTLRPGEITTSRVLVSFDASNAPKGNDGWHLGGIKLEDNNWLWRTAKSTTRDYRGEFPPTGDFDIGNNVRYAGSSAWAVGNHIFWGYHGEFWKNSETNKWNQVYHNGLFINQFGVVGAGVNNKLAPPKMAGNVISAVFVQPSGEQNVYLYHNDENTHCGIHRWKISGFDTVKEQTIPVSLSQAKNGLSGQYFKSNNFDNSDLVASVIDSSIHFHSLPLGSIRWIGYLNAPQNGNYDFYLSTNGKIKCWINDVLVIDRWKSNNYASHEFTSRVALTTHLITPIKIELADANNISLQWKHENISKAVISSSSLRPALDIES